MKERTNAFPYLDELVDFRFPPVSGAGEEGIVCQGGNLSPGMLLSAYRQGIFPWYGPGEPLLWWSPDPRFVLPTANLRVNATSRKLLRKRRYRITLDTAFPEVIASCAAMRRPGQRGTWIVPAMREAYTELHRLGYAHSAEAWEGDRLAGGLYGVSLGSAFFGESMFSRSDGASRAAFLTLALRLVDEGFTFVDSQVFTEYLAGMGASEVSREAYLSMLAQALVAPSRKGSWTRAFSGFPESSGLGRIESCKIPAGAADRPLPGAEGLARP